MPRSLSQSQPQSRSQTKGYGRHRATANSVKGRTTIVFVAFVALYGLLVVRLAYLQVWDHAYLKRCGETQRKSESILPAHRGQILDRNGEWLAVNVPANEIFANPAEINARAADKISSMAEQLSPLLGRSTAVIEHLLTRNTKTHYVSLLRHAPIDTGMAVGKLGLLGVSVGPDTRRSYPNNALGAQVLGFTDGDKGTSGIEYSQDALLEGKDGEMVGEVDQRGRFLPGTIRKSLDPQNGSDLILTIDKSLQSDADTELAGAVKAHHADRGVVVIMDPQTGEILAMSTAPTFDPNNPPRPPINATPQQMAAVAGLWRNSATSDLYEPGSTMKTITASAVLQDQGLQEMNRHVYCNGEMQIGNHTIHCAKDPPYYGVHGDEDLRGVLKESCNIGMAQFGMALGADRLYDFEQKFGFLDYPDSGLPGEVRSHLQSPAAMNKYSKSIGWSKIQLANISFGQGIAVTPLQLATAYCAIANGGLLMKPHIIRATVAGDKEDVVQPVVIRRVLDPQVAAAVRSMLGTVVQEGTGKPAQIGGFTMGGKTGSAQVAGNHGYEDGHYVASFIGMVPLSNPRLVILCSVFNPQGVHWGAAVAAPVVHDLARRATIEMHLTPDDPQMVDWEDRNKKSHAHQAIVTTVADIVNGIPSPKPTN